MNVTSETAIRRRGGFTLIEIVIVVLIIGIMAAISAPKFADTLHRCRVDSAVKRVKVDLSLVRQHAISSSSTQSAQFSPATDDYELSGLMSQDHAGTTLGVNLADPPYSAELVSASFGADSVVEFDRYGQPDSGGTVVVQSGGYQQTLTVDPATGKASIP